MIMWMPPLDYSPHSMYILHVRPFVDNDHRDSYNLCRSTQWWRPIFHVLLQPTQGLSKTLCSSTSQIHLSASVGSSPIKLNECRQTSSFSKWPLNKSIHAKLLYRSWFLTTFHAISALRSCMLYNLFNVRSFVQPPMSARVPFNATAYYSIATRPSSCARDNYLAATDECISQWATGSGYSSSSCFHINIIFIIVRHWPYALMQDNINLIRILFVFADVMTMSDECVRL